MVILCRRNLPLVLVLQVSSVAWHPIHETLLASGDKEGALMYWITE